MDVCTDDFSDPPREEVPDDDAPVIAADSQQGPPAVEGACERHADAVQSAIRLLHTITRFQTTRETRSPDSSLSKSWDLQEPKLVAHLWIVLPKRLWKHKDQLLMTEQTDSIYLVIPSNPLSNWAAA